MKKIEPPPEYPPEEGRYLRGNDYSPVAVVVILIHPADRIPQGIEALVRTGVESGAALSGTLQTENIGLEKVICNIVANPNIRYIVLCGPESPGHFTGETLIALMINGMDERKRIIGTKAPTPYLFNIPKDYVSRFRNQVKLIDLLNEGDPDIVRQAVWSCYQETPTTFREYSLSDPGAWPDEPLCGGITWRVTRPEAEPKDEEERRQVQKLKKPGSILSSKHGIAKLQM
ncbi:tetrahydromethanopterin S-methyltransferase subunit A [Candidatus Aerophobetes bacterium]|uniref:Tetrahydromethanopterin S-methyltransferase subunit A n=1 Tax=Aerophobetes bacterium TaxID=2030807 RepID=A0A523QG40_UNCAE|nr:MAG: tetrahydromethanopterin S-methyltransferase subunit A [Candidatus Aerophobetes bacterium]